MLGAGYFKRVAKEGSLIKAVFENPEEVACGGKMEKGWFKRHRKQNQRDCPLGFLFVGST